MWCVCVCSGDGAVLLCPTVKATFYAVVVCNSRSVSVLSELVEHVETVGDDVLLRIESGFLVELVAIVEKDEEECSLF